jgi:SAM-dependent methyltransferase
VLDIGTVKSDPAWISWLEGLDLEVHATDYDPPPQPYSSIAFAQSDVRDLPYDDDTFAAIMAVSVIEHIGLDEPQVDLETRPETSVDGDVEAVRELMRVLKPGGRLIMTLPFGLVDGLILGDKSARGYTMESLQRFEAVATATELHYYEYQRANRREHVEEFPRPLSLSEHVVKSVQNRMGGGRPAADTTPTLPQSHPGRVTWRRVSPEETQAHHRRHTDGVICGIWTHRN